MSGEKKHCEDLVTKLHWRMLVEVPLTAVLQDICLHTAEKSVW